jgi:hypothetical protein
MDSAAARLGVGDQVGLLLPEGRVVEVGRREQVAVLGDRGMVAAHAHARIDDLAAQRGERDHGLVVAGSGRASLGGLSALLIPAVRLDGATGMRIRVMVHRPASTAATSRGSAAHGERGDPEFESHLLDGQPVTSAAPRVHDAQGSPC